MDGLLRWTMAAACVLAACGGDVVVDGAPSGIGSAGGAGGQPTIGTGTGAGGEGGFGSGVVIAAVTVGPGTSVTTGTASTGSVFPSDDGGAPCTSCAASLTIGGEPCSGSPFEQHSELLDCACNVTDCDEECHMNLCVLLPASPQCFACLMANCDLSGCLAN